MVRFVAIASTVSVTRIAGGAALPGPPVTVTRPADMGVTRMAPACRTRPSCPGAGDEAGPHAVRPTPAARMVHAWMRLAEWGMVEPDRIRP